MANELRALNLHLQNLRVNCEDDYRASVFLKHIDEMKNEITTLNLELTEVKQEAKHITGSRNFYRDSFYVVLRLLVVKLLK